MIYQIKKKLKTNNIEHDLCILNAGTLGSVGLSHQISDEEFLQTLKINVHKIK